MADDDEPSGASDVPDFEPPQACIQRVIKSVLPENAQIMKESKQAYSKAAGIFIIYVTTWSVSVSRALRLSRARSPRRPPSPPSLLRRRARRGWSRAESCIPANGATGSDVITASRAQRERLLQGEEAPDDHHRGCARGNQVRAHSPLLGDRAASLSCSLARAADRTVRALGSQRARVRHGRPAERVPRGVPQGVQRQE